MRNSRVATEYDKQLSLPPEKILPVPDPRSTNYREDQRSRERIFVEWLEDLSGIYFLGKPIKEWRYKQAAPHATPKERSFWARIATLRDHRDSNDKTIYSYYQDIKSLMSFQARKLRLITLEQGYIGVTNAQVQPGDKVCLLDGCRIPAIRRESLSQNGRMYQVIGFARIIFDGVEILKNLGITEGNEVLDLV